jgi:hypothetical protein
MFEKLYLLRSFKEARDASLRALNLPGPSKGSCAVKAAGLGGLGQAALELVTLEHSANGMLKVFGQFFSGLASLSIAQIIRAMVCDRIPKVAHVERHRFRRWLAK